ncbi:MAG TPA: FtsW/RodA/SpoVE family cell cycle protein, partial [Burkholderiaceae bacterium]|nr:FtsW/RodA/SpoVE family cell cycle protein [Burkholderiaceae bacterium]
MTWLGALRERFAALRLGGNGAAALPIREWSGTSSSTPAYARGVDQALVWVVLALLALGLVMVYSASVALPDNPKFARYAPTHFLVRHALAIGIAFVAALAVVQVPIRIWERWAPWVFVGAIVLLVVVLVPFIGKGVNGARRWIPLGLMNFQPSELAKLGIALYAASYMVRKMDTRE